MTDQWSHNKHYHSVILGAVPAHAERALDVGCGQGTLVRRIRTVIPEVVGIDRDDRSIEIARSHPDRRDTLYQCEDFLTADLASGSFDLITAVASLHHMDATDALARMRELLRPGGVLAVVGLARGGQPTDWALTVPAVIGTRARRITMRGQTSTTAQYQSPTIWPPPIRYSEMRQIAQRLLPGMRYRRHLYWRYSITWAKPAATNPGTLNVPH